MFVCTLFLCVCCKGTLLIGLWLLVQCPLSHWSVICSVLYLQLRNFQALARLSSDCRVQIPCCSEWSKCSLSLHCDASVCEAETPFASVPGVQKKGKKKRSKPVFSMWRWCGVICVQSKRRTLSSLSRTTFKGKMPKIFVKYYFLLV